MKISRGICTAAMLIGSVLLSDQRALAAHSTKDYSYRARVLAKNDDGNWRWRYAQGATVGLYHKSLKTIPSSTYANFTSVALPVFDSWKVTNKWGYTRSIYQASNYPNTYRVITFSNRATVTDGQMGEVTGSLLSLVLQEPLSTEHSSNTGVSKWWNGTYYRTHKNAYYGSTHKFGDPLLIQDVVNRMHELAKANLDLNWHVRNELNRVCILWAPNLIGAGTAASAVRQTQAGGIDSGIMAAGWGRYPAYAQIVLGEILARKLFHGGELTDDIYQYTVTDGRALASSFRNEKPTALVGGVTAWLATLASDRYWFPADGDLLTMGGEAHIGNRNANSAKFRGLNDTSIQNVFCALWDLTDLAVDNKGPRWWYWDIAYVTPNRLYEDIHRATHDLRARNSEKPLTIQSAWDLRIRSRTGRVGHGTLLLNGINIPYISGISY